MRGFLVTPFLLMPLSQFVVKRGLCQVLGRVMVMLRNA
jgi:hypothetical protein